jgi:hypothetical protein
MKIAIYTSVFFCILFSLSCKKVKQKNINSEKTFDLFVLDTLDTPVNKCYDRVWGAGRADLMPCSNFAEGFKLPLNIKIDSSVFYFKSGDRTDTITFKYTKQFEPNAEFEVMFTIKQIKCTMGNLNLKCIPNLNQSCNGNQASFSASIYQ